MSRKEKNNIILIREASKQPYISLGVRYGGIKIQGIEYVHEPVSDSFILKDYFSKFKKCKNIKSFVELLKSEQKL